MRITVDTVNKTIEILNDISITELLDTIPNEWREFKLIKSKPIEVIKKIEIERDNRPYNPYINTPWLTERLDRQLTPIEPYYTDKITC